MVVQTFIDEVRSALSNTFREIDTWFDKPAELRAFMPASGGWSIDQILEHIGLTDHFLLIIIDKASTKALKRAGASELAEVLRDYAPQRDKLTEVGIHRSFPWIRPEHMEPNGTKSIEEVRGQLQRQLQQCLGVLAALPNGEGAIVRTTMSVHALGKIDVYEYLYFLAQHGQRHVMQMRRNESEFLSQR